MLSTCSHIRFARVLGMFSCASYRQVCRQATRTSRHVRQFGQSLVIMSVRMSAVPSVLVAVLVLVSSAVLGARAAATTRWEEAAFSGVNDEKDAFTVRRELGHVSMQREVIKTGVSGSSVLHDENKTSVHSRVGASVRLGAPQVCTMCYGQDTSICGCVDMYILNVFSAKRQLTAVLLYSRLRPCPVQPPPAITMILWPPFNVQISIGLQS